MRRKSMRFVIVTLTVGLLAPACGGHGGGTNPDGGTSDASGVGLPVGAACTADPECSGPSPDCIPEQIAPLAEFASSENAAAVQLSKQVVIDLPGGYCSNVAPCETDADCGDEGRCFRPLIDVNEQDYRDMVEILGLSEDETDTLVGFHEYGQCLRPCSEASDCTRPGYVCAVPLEDFLKLVQSMGARMETYCIGGTESLCDPNPCAHGTCSVNADATFTCACDTGWMGDLCDAEDPCEPNPCEHNGTCAVENGDATCTDCDAGWIGPLCDVDDPCEPDPCAHGTCTIKSDNSYECACDAGWIGTDCDADDPCLPNPCVHGGTCAVQGTAPLCSGCDTGWSGDLCDVPHDCGDPGAVSTPLQVSLSGGTTLGQTATYSCTTGWVLNGDASRTCTATGWTGTTPVCDPAPVVCETDTCNGHGTCVEVGGVFDHCVCDGGYDGPTCGTLVDCGAPDPAPTHGTLSVTTTTFGSTATYGCTTGYSANGATTVTCEASGDWSDPAPTCDPVDCGAPDPAPTHGTLAVTTTTYGSTATYGCDSGYGLVGADTVTCEASGDWSDAAPTCDPLYCDVVYAITGNFEISDAPMACGDTVNAVQDNAANPALEDGATTPFTTSSVFQKAFLRLRFPEQNGDPAPGAVQLVEYYFPIEFTTNCTGTTVTTNVDHSLGLLDMSGSPLTIPESPTLNRTCQGWATGTLTGTTLDWSACTVVPPATGMWWSHDDAQAGAGDTTTACAMRMSVWGHVGCTGTFCFLVPGRGNQRATWDQLLQNFSFSGTDLRTATFSMPQVQVPESTNENNTRAWVTITQGTPVHVECGPAANMTCDDQAP